MAFEWLLAVFPAGLCAACCPILIIFLLAAAYLLISRRKRAYVQEEPLLEFAKENGLSVVSGKIAHDVSGEFGGRTVRLGFFPKHGTVRFFAGVLANRAHADFVLRVSERRGPAAAGGLKEICTGKPEFDSKFLARTSDEERAKRLVTGTLERIEELFARHDVVVFEVKGALVYAEIPATAVQKEAIHAVMSSLEEIAGAVEEL